jgi:hypothetical protein
MKTEEDEIINSILKDTYKDFYREYTNLLEKNLDKIVQDLLAKKINSNEIIILKIAIQKTIGEDNKQEKMPVSVDNQHPVDINHRRLKK